MDYLLTKRFNIIARILSNDVSITKNSFLFEENNHLLYTDNITQFNIFDQTGIFKLLDTSLTNKLNIEIGNEYIFRNIKLEIRSNRLFLMFDNISIIFPSNEHIVKQQEIINFDQMENFSEIHLEYLDFNLI